METEFLDSKNNMKDDLSHILYDQDTVNKRCRQLGRRISDDYQNKFPLIVCVLKGGSVFMTHLIQNISIYIQIDFIDVSSYASGSTTSSGKIKLVKETSSRVKNRNVILVDDIVDTGRTWWYLKNLMKKRGAKSIAMCALLNKSARRQFDVKPNYTGFQAPNQWIVGCGMNYKGVYRNLPCIATLKSWIFQEH